MRQTIEKLRLGQVSVYIGHFSFYRVVLLPLVLFHQVMGGFYLMRLSVHSLQDCT